MTNCTIQQLQLRLSQSLSGIYDDVEARSMCRLLLMHHLKLTSAGLILRSGELVDCKDVVQIDSDLQRLLRHEPLQYVLGMTHFYGLDFSLRPGVLIPRPETEELVDWVLKDNALADPAILDIGTGSGCIAIALKYNIPESIVSAWDVSHDALSVANNNAQILGCRVSFRHVDVLHDEPSVTDYFDVVVSNPPYVRDLEKLSMSANVLEHEPHLALFVSDGDPLVFYRSIALKSLKMLKPGGRLYFEINEYLGAEMVQMLSEMGYGSVVLRQDLQGKDRMIRAMINS